MSSVVTDQSDCLNCGTPLRGEFCAGCGQNAADPNPTFHDLLHDVSHEVLHVDGRLWSSVRLLFTKPGCLTTEYISGRRAAYVPPVRLYLILSLIFFVLAVYAPLEMSVRMDPKRGRVLHTGGLDISGEILEGRTDEQVAEWLHRIEHEWMPRVMFVMVPVFALFTAGAARRQRRHFPQHLYFAVHTHAAWFGIFSLVELTRFARVPALSTGMVLAGAVAVVFYTTVAVRTVYGKSWLRAGLQTVTTLFGYLALLTIMTVALFILLYSTDLKKEKAGASHARLESSW